MVLSAFLAASIHWIVPVTSSYSELKLEERLGRVL